MKFIEKKYNLIQGVFCAVIGISWTVSSVLYFKEYCNKKRKKFSDELGTALQEAFETLEDRI